MMLHTPSQALSEQEQRQILSTLVDYCPGKWRYTCLAGSHVFELVDLHNTVDAEVEVENIGGKRRYMVNMNAGPCMPTIYNKMHESLEDAATEIRPLVECGRRQMKELMGLGNQGDT